MNTPLSHAAPRVDRLGRLRTPARPGRLQVRCAPGRGRAGRCHPVHLQRLVRGDGRRESEGMDVPELAAGRGARSPSSPPGIRAAGASRSRPKRAPTPPGSRPSPSGPIRAIGSAAGSRRRTSSPARAGAPRSTSTAKRNGGRAPVTGTQDWTRVEIEFDAGANDALDVTCLFGGWGRSTGKAWFDDIELVRLSGKELGRPTVMIDAGKTGTPMSKYIYGQFIEHLGRCIYQGIWAEMLEDRKFFWAGRRGRIALEGRRRRRPRQDGHGRSRSRGRTRRA